MSAIAIIPARGGSKGIPKKNLFVVGGKPLIAWTIEAAKGCPAIESVVVSSDDQDILHVAESLGAEALVRPAELASDTAEAKPVLQHALVEYEKTHGALPEWVVYLQPTSPLRSAKHLTEAFALLEKDPSADAVMGVYEVDNAFLKTSITDTGGFLIPASNPAYANMNRQSLPKLYMPNGSIFIMKAALCRVEPRFDGTRTLPYIMSAEESIDLDSPEDISDIERALASR